MKPQEQEGSAVTASLVFLVLGLCTAFHCFDRTALWAPCFDTAHSSQASPDVCFFTRENHMCLAPIQPNTSSFQSQRWLFVAGDLWHFKAF